MRLDSTRSAVIDPTYHYRSIADEPPPIGPRMLLINEQQGIATIDKYRPSDKWYSHWCPLPTMPKRKPT